MNGNIDGPFGRGAGDDITVGTGKDCQSADLIGDDAGAVATFQREGQDGQLIIQRAVGSAPAVQGPVNLA